MSAAPQGLPPASGRQPHKRSPALDGSLVGSAPALLPMERSAMGGRAGERYEVRKHPKAIPMRPQGAMLELHMQLLGGE